MAPQDARPPGAELAPARCACACTSAGRTQAVLLVQAHVVRLNLHARQAGRGCSLRRMGQKSVINALHAGSPAACNRPRGGHLLPLKQVVLGLLHGGALQAQALRHAPGLPQLALRPLAAGRNLCQAAGRPALYGCPWKVAGEASRASRRP